MPIAPDIRFALRRILRRGFALLPGALIAFLFLAAPSEARAQDFAGFLASIIGIPLQWILWFLGKLLTGAILLLMWVAQYNNFIDAPAVVHGWVIVRDVANMFFIVVLLIIAFATILNVQAYQWKSMLPQLLGAAILINFSKTIAGLLIDISQVLMLTFVNGFAAAAAGNFANMFQIQHLVALDPASGAPAGGMQIIGGYLLAIALVTIALMTTVVMVAMLVGRMVMLWALIVLSPLPYLLNVLPQGKSYASQWWSEFGKYLVTGPVLAFFLWLALVSVGSGTAGEEIRKSAKVGASEAEVADFQKNATLGTAASGPESLLSFIISIAMLMAGLQFAGKSGAAGSGMATAAAGKVGSFAKGAAYRLTGARAVRERWQAFQGMREGVRKEKVQAGAAKLYGAYGTALAAPGKLLGKVPTAGTLVERRAATLEQRAAAARKAGKHDEAKALEKSAYNWRAAGRWGDRGIAAGSVIMALPTGGASLLGLAAVAGKGGKALQRSGEAAKAAGRDYKYKEVSKALDAMKDTKKDEVLATMQGKKPGATSHERAAAFLRATKEGWLESNEVAGGEDFLESLGADDKTKSTFRSYAEQKYAGTMVSGDERRKRIEAGTMPTKDLHPEELSKDNGSLASDFVLHGTPDQRKELGKSRALKDAYKQGVLAAFKAEKAKGASADPIALEKLGEELLRVGAKEKDASGREMSTLETARSYGLDATQLEKALQGSESSSVLANITPADLAADPTLLSTIAANVSAARFRSAKGAATKGDDPANAVNVAAIEAAVKGSTEYAIFERGQSTVRGATSHAGGIRKAFDAKQAELARTPSTDPGYAAIKAGADQLEKDLDKAERDLKDAKSIFEVAMKAAGVTDSQRGLYEGMQTKRK